MQKDQEPSKRSKWWDFLSFIKSDRGNSPSYFRVSMFVITSPIQFLLFWGGGTAWLLFLHTLFGVGFWWFEFPPTFLPDWVFSHWVINQYDRSNLPDSFFTWSTLWRHAIGLFSMAAGMVSLRETGHLIFTGTSAWNLTDKEIDRDNE